MKTEVRDEPFVEAILDALAHPEVVELRNPAAVRALRQIELDAERLVAEGGFEHLHGQKTITDRQSLRDTIRELEERWPGYVSTIGGSLPERVGELERKEIFRQKRGESSEKRASRLETFSHILKWVFANRRKKFVSGGIIAGLLGASATILGLLLALDGNRQQRKELDFLFRQHEQQMSLAQQELELMERQTEADEAALAIARKEYRKSLEGIAHSPDPIASYTEEPNRESDPVKWIALIASGFALLVASATATAVSIRRHISGEPQGEEDLGDSPYPEENEAIGRTSSGSTNHEVEESQRPGVFGTPQRIEIDGLVDLSQRLERLLQRQEESADSQKLEISELVRVVDLLSQFLQQRGDAVFSGTQSVEVTGLQEVAQLLRKLLSREGEPEVGTTSSQSGAQLIVARKSCEVMPYDDGVKIFRDWHKLFSGAIGEGLDASGSFPQSGLASLLQMYSITVHDFIFIYHVAHHHNGGVKLEVVRAYMEQIGSYPNASIFACVENLTRRGMIAVGSNGRFYLSDKARKMLSENQEEVLFFGAMLGELKINRR